MGYVIGCDIGSQAVKVILLSDKGDILGEVDRSYSIDFPYPAWAQQDARDWEIAIMEAVGELLRQHGIKRDAVLAIGLDAQVDGVVAVSADGQPLSPAIIWMDRRAVPQTDAIARAVDPRHIFDMTGLNLDAYHVAPKIRWLAENNPRVFEEARYFLMPGSYVAFWLTGELGVDYSNASSMLLMDIRKRAWSAELCELFGVSLDHLPPIYPANHVLGTLRPALAERMGLSSATRVILGCGDEHAASLGAGVIKSGMVCDIAGTAEPVCAAAAAPFFDESGLVETHCHAHPDFWLLENPGFVSGGNYRWFRDHFAGEEVLRANQLGMEAYDLLNEMAASVSPGSEGLLLLPCLMGAVTPTWNAHARGAFLGFSLTHRRAHFVRAVLEASAYALRDITDRMQEIGLQLNEIRAVGGGARSALWRQIKADVTGLPVCLLNTVETTALGAALLALQGAGLATTLDEAVEMTVKVLETREPDPLNHARYDEYYQIYRAAYFALLPVFEKAARISA